MFVHTLREIRMALLLALAMVAPARAASPGPGFKLNRESSFISLDRQVRLAIRRCSCIEGTAINFHLRKTTPGWEGAGRTAVTP